MAVPESLRNLTDARDGTSVERCDHAVHTVSSSSLRSSSFSSRDDVGRTVVGSNVAFSQRPRKFPGARNRSSVQRHEEVRPYCDLFFFLMRGETDPTEAVPPRHVSTESLFS